MSWGWRKVSEPAVDEPKAIRLNDGQWAIRNPTPADVWAFSETTTTKRAAKQRRAHAWPSPGSYRRAVRATAAEAE